MVKLSIWNKHFMNTYSEKNNKDGERNHRFFGPAANCDELGLIGYTLNGYYFVKKTTDSTKKGSIGIVYCQFQQLDDQKQSKIKTIITNQSDLEILKIFSQNLHT